jgi:hypothetical protein
MEDLLKGTCMLYDFAFQHEISHDILACKFDLGSTTMNNYTNGLLALEYLADRCLTEEAHRVLLNVMTRQVNKLFSIQQLIQFIECSQQDILQKRNYFSVLLYNANYVEMIFFRRKAKSIRVH